MYALVIFLSAFLLFQVQPVVAKFLLPYFGGSSAVWATCMLFFQAVLLLGYLYADLTARRIAPRRQLLTHGAVSAATLFFLPLSFQAAAGYARPDSPVSGILLLLTITVGAPYFLLSTTSPLVQSWYAGGERDARPYHLYAWSNAGSMLGLLSYPFLVEPFLTLRHQALLWSCLYGLCVLLVAFLAFFHRGVEGTSGYPAADRHAERTPAGERLLWVALAATPVVLLLAVTNHLTQNIPPFPFLWILPLSLYLASFIICFAAEGRFYRRRLWLAAAAIALPTISYLVSPGVTRVIWLVPALLAALFACCMACHGELYRRRPAASRLTLFYLMLALGGVLGGLFVGALAPYLFPGFYEMQIGIATCAAMLGVLYWREAPAGRRRLEAIGIVPVIALLAYLGYTVWDDRQSYLVQRRNFYGVVRVSEEEPDQPAVARRLMAHGNIVHGIQWLHPARSGQPTTYFGVKSGVGLALLSLPPGPKRVGVVGLGVGTLAAYGRPGDFYRFYEINPIVTELAKRNFNFLSKTQARVEIVPGDGRLSLDHEPDQIYDLLVLDAFSGGVPPVHLLTREAFATYLRHIRPGGIIAVNCSNWYLDLPEAVLPVVQSAGLSAIVVSNPPDEPNQISHATWLLATRDPTWFIRPPFDCMFPLAPARLGQTPWSDDYSNLFRIVKLGG